MRRDRARFYSGNLLYPVRQDQGKAEIMACFQKLPEALAPRRPQPGNKFPLCNV